MTAAAEEYERNRTTAAEEYERKAIAAAKEYTEEKDATARQMAALNDKFDKYKEEYDRDREVHQREYSHLVQEQNAMRLWMSSKVISFSLSPRTDF